MAKEKIILKSDEEENRLLKLEQENEQLRLEQAQSNAEMIDLMMAMMLGGI